MKTKIAIAASTLGIGMAVLFLTGCHHLGGGCGYMPAPAPVATASAAANATPPVNTPAQANAPATHQH